MVRKFFQKHHNRILRLQASANGIMFILAACCLDSEGYTAQVVCVVTLLWLAMFSHVNGYFEETNKIFQYEEDETI